MLYAKCHFMQDTANPAKGGSAVTTLRFCSAAVILIFHFGLWWKIAAPACGEPVDFLHQTYCKRLELADVDGPDSCILNLPASLYPCAILEDESSNML
jgi:hypothetical protein